VEGLSAALGMELSFLSKGTTSLVFAGRSSDGRSVLVKLQRPDSPRANLFKEFKLLEFLAPLRVAPRPIGYGRFSGLEFIVREIADGVEIRNALDIIEGAHVFSMAYKALTLDRLGLDHGQIQGGKHVIVGEDVWFIDFEKAGFRRSNNLTALLSMLFLGGNVISRTLSRRFGLDWRFRGELLRAVRIYKSSGNFRPVFDVLERHLPSRGDCPCPASFSQRLWTGRE